MANGHGGYRKPANPAPVSGPGKYSRRTDGGPAQVISAAPNQPYGEAGQQRMAQRLAPMGAADPMPAPASPTPDQQQAMRMPQFNGPSLTDPTQRPNEPITAGADIGPGPGSEALNLPISGGPQGTGAMTALLQQFASTDATGALAPLLTAASARNV